MRELTSYAFLVPVLLFAAVCLACSAGPAAARQRVAVLRDDFPYANNLFVDRLIDNLREAVDLTVIDGTDLPNLLEAKPRRVDVLLLPDSRFFPARGLDALQAYLKQGGDLLVVGGPAFSKLMVEHGGKWYDKTGALDVQTTAEPTRLLADIEEGSEAFRLDCEDSGSKTTLTVQDSGDATLGKCIRVDIPSLSDRELVVFDDLKYPFAGGYLTTFWAKGDGSAADLEVQWKETDGSYWFTKVALEPRWRKYAIPSYDLKFNREASKGVKRGGTGDHFNPENAVRLSIGQRRAFTAKRDGSHSFSLAQIGAATDDFAGLDFTPPVLETLSPAYKVFQFTDTARLEPYKNQVVFGEEVKKLGPGNVVCPIWRARGLGLQKPMDFRWIPLISAFDSSGQFRGTPVSMMLNVDNSYGSSVWGLVGFADPDFLKKYSGYVIDITRTLLAKMNSGVFLQCAGTEHFGYFTGEKINIGIRAGNHNLGRMTKVEMTIKHGENIDYTHSWPVENWVDTKEELKSLALAPGYYNVETKLYEGDMAADLISYEISVVDTNRKIGPDLVTQRDGDFWLQGRKWYPIGINFWPLYCAGQEPEQYHGKSWQSPAQYDPEWIKLDLDQLVSLGMNSVSIQFPAPNLGRPIVDFLERCRDRGIKVNVSVDGHPISGHPEGSANRAKETHLGQNDTVYSYDLAWEPHLGPESERKALDPKWRRWIEDRYGSVANAEDDWEFTITRSDGSVSGPTDNQLMGDGDWNKMVAAYRRFADDIISKGYGKTVRAIRRVDPNHLFGVRTGYGGTGQPGIAHHFPFDLISGIKHLDYTSPEGYGLGGEYINYRRAGLLNIYGRFVSGGRPVFWAEYGVPQYFQGNTWSWSEAGQTRYFANMHKMFYETDVNGGAGWWWPGGHRVDEDSDFGIINPDRTPRPAALEYKKAANQFKNPPQRKPADYWIEIDRDLHANGLPSVWLANAEEYLRVFEEGKTVGLKTKGTGTDSSNTPMLAVGNTPLNGHNPPKYLNAEFNWLLVQDASGNWVEVADGAVINVTPGKPVKAKTSIGNTAESAWLTPTEAGANNGGVYLCAGDGDTVAQKWPIPVKTPYLADATLQEFEIAAVKKETKIALWMLAEGRSPFGEKLRFTLSPAAAGKGGK